MKPRSLLLMIGSMFLAGLCACGGAGGSDSGMGGDAQLTPYIQTDSAPDHGVITNPGIPLYIALQSCSPISAGEFDALRCDTKALRGVLRNVATYDDVSGGWTVNISEADYPAFLESLRATCSLPDVSAIGMSGANVVNLVYGTDGEVSLELQENDPSCTGN